MWNTPGVRSSLRLLAACFVLAACSAARNPFAPGSSGDATEPPPAGDDTSPPPGTLGGGDAGTPPKPCVPDPANYDVPGNGCDDDGDGIVDNPPTCDTSLAQVGTAEEFARALGICATVAKNGYGLVSAKFTRGYGSTDAPMDDQHGVLAKFGTLKPREGQALGVLSTGYAREYDGDGQQPFGGSTGFPPTPNGKDWYGFGPGGPSTTTGNGIAPPGFPKPAAGCPASSVANDVIDVHLELKAPRNAAGVKFDFDFYSGEWPHFICSEFNDSFVAYLHAQGFNGGAADNMSFDSSGNPVSVNNGFFDRCKAGVTTGCGGSKTATSTCPGGVGELASTGFGIEGPGCDGFTSVPLGGATGWLTSKAPVQAGETFTLDFVIWDTGDAVLDSSVLLDNFQWLEGEVKTDTERPH